MVGGQRHAPAALPPGTQMRVGLEVCLEEYGKSRTHRGSNPGPLKICHN